VVNGRLVSCTAVLLLALAVLTATAAQRSAEYDEQYTLFLTAGIARPAWPDAAFAAGEVRTLQAGHASLIGIARDLRATDVHPPLYFWCVALWRRLAGGGLFAARLFSVLCAVSALATVGLIACRTGVPPLLAMLLTLGCYGFAYTGAIARGFALAQALILWGVAVSLSGRRRWLAGVMLGAATFTNYLAVFVALAVSPAMASWSNQADRNAPVVHRSNRSMEDDGERRAAEQSADRPHHPRRPRPATSSALAAATLLAVFFAADLWFLLPQHNSRAGQFPTFHLFSAMARLAGYAAANLLGGLPLYVPAPARNITSALLALLALATVGLVAARWRCIAASPAARRLLLRAALAPAVGLLTLGAVFHNTPIELRYLAFATPFAALLLAGACASLPASLRRATIALLLAVQAVSLLGLMTRQETMQPARATAEAASRLTGEGVVLLPRGNDGVGIVGAFAIESPPGQRLLVVARGETPAHILARLGASRRVALALLAQDEDSRATVATLRQTFATSCWRPGGEGFNVLAFDRVCEDVAPWPSSTASR